MIGGLDRLSRRALIVAIGFCVAMTIFVVAAQRQARELGALGAGQADAREQAAERSAQIAAWGAPTAEERAAWTAIAAQLEAMLPAGDVPLHTAQALTLLADRFDFRDVSVAELREEVGPGSRFSDEDEAAESADAPDAGGAWVELDFGEEVPWRVQRHEFEMSFWARYEGLMGFLAALGGEGRLIEARAVTITREAPGVRVTVELAAYGRST